MWVVLRLRNNSKWRDSFFIDYVCNECMSPHDIVFAFTYVLTSNHMNVVNSHSKHTLNNSLTTAVVQSDWKTAILLWRQAQKTPPTTAQWAMPWSCVRSSSESSRGSFAPSLMSAMQWQVAASVVPFQSSFARKKTVIPLTDVGEGRNSPWQRWRDKNSGVLIGRWDLTVWLAQSEARRLLVYVGSAAKVRKSFPTVSNVTRQHRWVKITGMPPPHKR